MVSQVIQVFSDDGSVADPLPHGDRRGRVRVLVHWPFIFCNHAGLVSEAITLNLSSQGLYFHADEPSVPGEIVTGALMVPAYNPEDATQVIPVTCRVRILRVEALTGNRFGIGCRIEEYHVQAAARPPSGGGSPYNPGHTAS
jgi:hypothetical protein